MRHPIWAGVRQRLATSTAIVILACATPAVADRHHDDHWHHDGHGHDHWQHWHRPWDYAGGYYAPPPVVYSRPYYAPPPVVYTPGFGLNIHIP